MNPSRRFIAGATCPSCQMIDKICYQKTDVGQTIECVHCGFTNTLPHEEDTP